MPTRYNEKRRDDGSLIWRINRETRKGRYYLNEGRGQRSFISILLLDGFTSLPSGFRRSGAGLTGCGWSLLNELNNKYGSRLRLMVSATRPTSITETATTTRVTINHEDLRQLGLHARQINIIKNLSLNTLAQTFLHRNFPEEFQPPGTTELTGYEPGNLSALLGTIEDLSELSVSDSSALSAFYPAYIASMDFSLRSPNNIEFIESL